MYEENWIFVQYTFKSCSTYDWKRLTGFAALSASSFCGSLQGGISQVDPVPFIYLDRVRPAVISTAARVRCGC